MMKHITDYDGMPCYIIECDSCNIRIASCIDFEYNKGQELVYAPILCETCGRKHNKDCGDDVQHLIKAEKLLIKNGILNQEGYQFKYVDEKTGELSTERCQ